MQLFTALEDATAILRLPKGVQKQVKMYRRGDRVYVPHGGGYIEVRALQPTTLETSSGCYSTSHPDVQVLDFEMGASHPYYRATGGLANDCLRLGEKRK